MVRKEVEEAHVRCLTTDTLRMKPSLCGKDCIVRVCFRKWDEWDPGFCGEVTEIKEFLLIRGKKFGRIMEAHVRWFWSSFPIS